MKKLLIAVFAVAALASCKKESVGTPAEPVFTKKMKSSASTYSNSTPDSETFTYDAQGRVSVIVEDSRTSTIDYSTPGKVVATLKNNNVLQYTVECDINAKGLISKAVYIKPDASILTTYNYEYNADGYMTKSEFVPTVGSASYREIEWLNGNDVKAKNFSNGVLTGTTDYSIDLNQYNTLGFASGGVFPSPLFGKKSKNVSKSAIAKDVNNTVYFNAEYTNTKNAEGYLIGRSFLNKLNNSTGTTTYQYE